MRTGVVGSGRMGSVHARTLAEHPDVDELVIADPDGARAEEVADEHDARAVASVDELLGLDVDAVVIAAPTSAHAELLRSCTAAGVATFCEKPIALDLDTTREVVEHVHATGVPVQMGFQRRFDAGYRAARELISDGGLGRVYSFRIAAHDPEPPPPGYLEHAGSIFRDLHIHDFDAVRFLFEAEVSEVYATGAVRVSEEFADHGDVDTSAFLLRMDDGSLGVATGGRHDPRGYDIRMEVFGARDSVAVGLDDRTPLRSTEPGAGCGADPAYRDFIDRFEAAYRAEIDAFLDVAAGRAETACTVEDAHQALRIAVAADRSLAAAEPVAVDAVD